MKHASKKFLAVLSACALLLLAGVSSGAWADVKIDAANFPDENFRRWVKEKTAGGGDVLTDAQIAAVEEMDLSFSEISSLKGVERFTARLRFAREESEEAERLRGQPGKHGGDDRGARTGDHGMGETFSLTGFHEHGAGIGDPRHAGVGNVRDIAPVLERADHFLGAFALIVRMQRPGRFFDAEVIEQKPGMARVLAVDHVDRGQDLDRARREIAEVSDGRCDEVQHQRILVRRLLPRSSTIEVSAPSIMRLATRSP